MTGLGLVTPLGVGLENVWSSLLASHTALTRITADNFPAIAALDLPSKVCAPLPDFTLTDYVPASLLPSTSPFIHYAMTAAHLALADAKYAPSTDEQLERTGVCIGSGIGSVEEPVEQSHLLSTKGRRGTSPYAIPRLLVNLAAGQVSIRYGFKGPNHSVSTACTTGAHSIGDAYRFIQHGDADVMLAGGAEQGITPLSLTLFSRCRALSTHYNDRPAEASRPFSSGRDGFVMGEGAAVLVLEELEHARARGAKVYAEVRGYGCSADAHHITAPADDGSGAYRSMQRALHTANLLPSHIDYINAHATSTPLGDRAEHAAIKRLFQQHAHSLAVSSTKGAVGHMLGAAGAVEAAFTVLAIRNQCVPPTLNWRVEGEEAAVFDLNYVSDASQQRRVRAALTNSFGFGGTNASLVFAEVV